MKLTEDRCLAIYVTISILTFGYVASADRKVDPGLEITAIQSAIAGVAWPLYWTWEGFAAGRQALKGGE